MKVTQVYEFSDADLKLLQETLPDNPCDDCPDRHYCCGCPKQSKYVEQIKPYKYAGVYDIACSIKEYRKINSRIKHYQREIINLKSKLTSIEDKTPQDIKNLLATKHTSDVAEVVRCKDCKHYDSTQCYHPSYGNDCGIHTGRSENDFCSFGERKENL